MKFFCSDACILTYVCTCLLNHPLTHVCMQAYMHMFSSHAKPINPVENHLKILHYLDRCKYKRQIINSDFIQYA